MAMIVVAGPRSRALRMLMVAVIAGSVVAGPARGAACGAKSGPRTLPLVELYTSEGCSSCPPADVQLARLRPGTTLVPLALHVGYWDDLGWRDPYAQDGFARRQGWLAKRGGRCAFNGGSGS